MRALRFDCDADAVLALVEPAGPACHTGERTCFFTGDLEPPAPHEALPGARAHDRRARRRRDPAAPTPPQLLADPALIGEKVQEEAEEVARAAREETDERVAEEAADVLYHLTVLLRGRGLALADAEEVLAWPPPLSRLRGHRPTLEEVARRSTGRPQPDPGHAHASSRTARRRSPRS